MLPANKQLISLVGLNSLNDSFIEIINVLKSQTKTDTDYIIHEPFEEDIKKSEVQYFCTYQFTKLGLSIHVDLDIVNEVSFNSSIDLYGNNQIPYDKNVFGIDLKTHNRVDVNNILGEPVNTDDNNDFYKIDNKIVQVGYCLNNQNVLSYISVRKI